MQEEKNISIKIKSKTERHVMEDYELEMISEWNYRRIIYALVVLVFLVIIPAYYFNSLDNSDIVKIPPLRAVPYKQDAVKEAPLNKQSLENVATITPLKGATLKPFEAVNEETPQYPSEKSAKRAIQNHVSSAIADLNPHISRAQLAEGINNREPYGAIKLPVLVDTTRAYGITYFTEVNNMQGHTVFHEWLKEKKSVYKRKINIKGNRWRIATSKLFSYHSTGQWQARIITQQGEVLNKIKFSVDKR